MSRLARSNDVFRDEVAGSGCASLGVPPITSDQTSFHLEGVEW
jgi:hypothetical protein